MNEQQYLSRTNSTVSDTSTCSANSTDPLVSASQTNVKSNSIIRQSSMRLESVSEEGSDGDIDTERGTIIRTSHVSNKTFVGANGVTAVLITALLIMVVNLYVDNGELKAEIRNLNMRLKNAMNSIPEEEKGFCLACGALQNVHFKVFDDVKDHFKISDDRKKCCIEDLQTFFEIIKKTAESKLYSEIINGNLCNYRQQAGQQEGGTSGNNCSNVGNEKKPAAHLVRGGPPSPVHEGEEGKELKEWLADRDKAFRQGLGYQDGRLVILKTGNYYIYSQVFFVETFPRMQTQGAEPSATSSNGPKRLWHAIYRFNDDYPNNKEDVLLKSTQSKCWAQDKEFGLYSSYLGAVMSLRAGDQLLIKVSNVTLVSSETASTYFGVYMV